MGDRDGTPRIASPYGERDVHPDAAAAIDYVEEGYDVNPAGSDANGWAYHEAVLKDGMVYDRLTGPAGMTTDAYKALWQYADAINFGF